MTKMPDPLRRSTEKFFLGVTEEMDPLLSLQLTQLVINLGDSIYAMGFADGVHSQQEKEGYGSDQLSQCLQVFPGFTPPN